MVEDRTDMMLRLLRDIRSTQDDHSRRFEKVERHLEELREGMYTALGMAGHSQVVVEGHGERFDEMADEIAALKRRVAALETHE